MILIINPAGPTHLVEMFAATPNSGLSSTVHIRVIADPIDGVETLLDTVTESRIDETVHVKKFFAVI